MKTKKKILKTALKLFIEIGFWEVSINDIIKEVGITKNDFYNYFNNKDQLICEVIEECFFSRFDDIIKITDECDGLSKGQLFGIFQKYSETESYLKDNFSVEKFNYESIIYLLIEGIENYELMTKYIVDFNERLLEKIESVIEEGKILGEILSTVDSKSIAINTLLSLQSSIVLWAMNQNIDIKILFETDFRYLWNTIKSS